MTMTPETSEPFNAGWQRPLPALQAALTARYPRVRFDCVLQTNCMGPEPFQTVTFSGRREDLTFVPPPAFVQRKYDAPFCDANGDYWHMRSQDDDGVCVWYGIWHSRANSAERPWNARRWPLKGIQSEVDGMLRKAFARPRERASG
jgi:hypothetical protein